jgi:hypothetical protein
MDHTFHIIFSNVQAERARLQEAILLSTHRKSIDGVKIAVDMARFMIRLSPRLAMNFAGVVAPLCALIQNGSLRVSPINTFNALKDLEAADEWEDGEEGLKEKIGLVIFAACADLHAHDAKEDNE